MEDRWGDREFWQESMASLEFNNNFNLIVAFMYNFSINGVLNFFEDLGSFEWIISLTDYSPKGYR